MDQRTLIACLPPPTSPVDADALFRLGLRYSTHADGCEPDLVAAHALFDLAARAGSLEAKVYRHELGEEMDVEDIIEAQALARAWLAER